jgi:hypothetical protein
VIIWVRDGYLAGLEYAWWCDPAPSEMPDADRVRMR